jgi:hypothetical protein
MTIEAPTDRSMTLLGQDGDLELTWDAESDSKVLPMIEKKMKEGYRFFILKPVLGDLIHVRRKLVNIDEIKTRNIKIKDHDIEALFTNGDVSLFRTQSTGKTIETAGIASTPAQVVQNRTVGTKALQGG